MNLLLVVICSFMDLFRLVSHTPPKPNLRVEHIPDPSACFKAAYDSGASVPDSAVIGLLCTGSMRPYVDRDGYIVRRKANYDDIKVGDVLHSTDGILHTAARKDSKGWVTWGANNHHEDTDRRVTPNNFDGIVEAFYGYDTPPKN